MESLLEGEAEQLTQKAIELALGGDITAPTKLKNVNPVYPADATARASAHTCA
jgi:hypothetical protein